MKAPLSHSQCLYYQVICLNPTGTDKPLLKLGNKTLEVVKEYKYLGIEETLVDDYSAFLKRKKREVNLRILRVNRAGGRRGGYRPQHALRLYNALIRPKIEFGMTSLPYTESIIECLEDLQLKSLRRLFGFSKNTKKETIRAICGVTSMKTRMAYYKLIFSKQSI